MVTGRGESDSRHFDGFDSPTTTPVPDVVFDEFLSWLGEAELKALLYIIRRTFGFKKNEDPISFNQFLRGITTRDGRALDQGCGVRSRTTLSGALKSLESKGIIQSAKGVDERGENQTTVYSLRFRHQRAADQEAPVTEHGGSSKGVVRNSYHGGTASAPPVVRQTYPQQTGLQETVKQQTALSSNHFEDIANLQKPTNSKFSKKRNVKIQNVDVIEDRDASSLPAGQRGFTAGGKVLAERSVSPPARKASRKPRKRPITAPSADDAAYVVPAESALPRPSRGRPPKATEQIVAVLEQISGEFHDDEHLQSNIGQAARLWKASGLHEAAFVGRLYEARSITKQRGDIQKRASGEAGEWGARNRMPYFFVVVRDLLGMKERQGHAEG